MEKKEGEEEECKKYNNSVTRSQTKYKKMKKSKLSQNSRTQRFYSWYKKW